MLLIFFYKSSQNIFFGDEGVNPNVLKSDFVSYLAESYYLGLCFSHVISVLCTNVSLVSQVGKKKKRTARTEKGNNAATTIVSRYSTL